MVRTVTDIETLQEYVNGVIARTDHHAKGVDLAALALVGMIIWRKDPDSELKVMEREGKMTNVLWVSIGGNDYALSFDHVSEEIQIRDRTVRGERIRSFDNSTSIAEIKEFFAQL